MKRPARWGASVTPQPGEAMDAFLIRLAAHTGLRTNHLLARIGSGLDLRTMLTGEDANAIDSLSQALAIPAETLSSLTLHRAWVRHNWVSQRDIDAIASAPGRRMWCTTDGSAACPHCIHSTGTWQLAWRLPWVWACPLHNVWLEPICPSCRQPYLRHTRPRTSHQTYAPTTCGNPITDRQHCTQTLPHQAATITEDMLRAQDRWHAEPAATCAINTDIRETATLLLALATAGAPKALTTEPDVEARLAWEALNRPTQHRRWALRAPLSPHLRAYALTTASRIVDGDPAATTNAIDALRNLPLNNSSLSTWVRDHCRPAPTPARLAEAAAAHRGTTTTFIRHQPRQQQDHSIPQLMPEDLVNQHLTGLSRCGTITLRAYAALTWSLRHGATTWAEAATALDLPADLGPRTARAVHARLIATKYDLRQACDQVGQAHLDRPHRIDYPALRTRLKTVHTDTIRDLVDTHATPGNIRTAHATLWTTIALNHPSTNPWTPDATPPPATDLRLIERLTALAFPTHSTSLPTPRRPSTRPTPSGQPTTDVLKTVHHA